MAASNIHLPSSHMIFNRPSSRCHRVLLLRCQSLSEEGKPMDMVEENLRVLRERMKDLRKKERHNINAGWNYNYLSRYGNKEKMIENNNFYRFISDCFEVMGIFSGAVGLVIVCGSLGLYLISLLVHYFG